jgi:uncharacterized OB-fold protein
MTQKAYTAYLGNLEREHREERMTRTNNNQKPIPLPDEASQPFFDGAREHRLMIQKCTSCGAVMWPVKSRCDNCLAASVTWIQARGKGTLYSFVLMHQVYHPGFAATVPYNIAQVDLVEGLRMISNVVGCSNENLRIGMPLEVTFEDVSEAVTLPKFKPADQSWLAHLSGANDDES